MVTPSKALGNRTPEQLKVTELREELRKRGIQIKGLKKDLVDRLEDVLRQEEMEQQKAFETNAPAPAPVETVLPDPKTPVRMKHSKGHAHEAEGVHADIVVSTPTDAATVGETEVPGNQRNTVLPSEHPTEELTVPPVPDAETKSQKEDPAFHSIAVEETDKLGTASQNARDETDQIATEPEVLDTQPVTMVGESREPVLGIAENEDKHANSESPSKIKVVAVDEGVLVETIFKDSNESLERKEEPQMQAVRDEIIHAVDEENLSEKSIDVVPAVKGVVDEAVGEEEEVVIRTVEKTVLTTVEDQIVSVDPKDLDDTGGQSTIQEERIVTTSTIVAGLEESTTVTSSTEKTTAMVVNVEEISTVVVAGEHMKRDAEVFETLECKSDDPMGEAPTEDALKEDDKVTVAEEPNDGTLMDVDVDSLKGSKRKDAGDGEITISEPTKRRRWNSSKGDEDDRGPGIEIPPLELQESTARAAVSSQSASVSSTAALTPKIIPSDKLAVTRTAPVRTEALGNGENQKTRVVPPSAKPATTSLKIDRFLRPFTFKAVKELLAQTGTVQDIWMDQIKTHCYVTYLSVVEATATRNALYNLQWPPQGGRLLTAEFVDPSEVKLRSDGEKASAAVAPTPTAAPSPNAVIHRGAMSANSKAPTDGAASLPPPPPLPLPSKEKSKLEVERTPTLDDLFRKTRSKPHIYYLPLTVKEVADKLVTKNPEAASKPAAKA